MVNQRKRAAVGASGFTLIELLVVMAVMALLLSVALPSYFGAMARARETVLRENLRTLRLSLDKFLADRGRYPSSLDELVEQRYLLAVPLDPLSGSARSWVIVPPRSMGGEPAAGGAVGDVRSGAPGQARDGSSYASF